MGTIKKDPLGILKPSNNNDPLGILKKKDLPENPLVEASPTGTESISPSISPSASTLDDQILTNFNNAYGVLNRYVDENITAPPPGFLPNLDGRMASDNARVVAPNLDVQNIRNQNAAANSSVISKPKDVLKKQILDEDEDGGSFKFLIKEINSKSANKKSKLQSEINRIQQQEILEAKQGGLISSEEEVAERQQQKEKKRAEITEIDNSLSEFNNSAFLLASKKAEAITRKSVDPMKDSKSFVRAMGRNLREIMAEAGPQYRSVKLEKAAEESGRSINPDDKAKNDELGLTAWANSLALKRAQLNKQEIKDPEQVEAIETERGEWLNAYKKSITDPDNVEYYRRQLGRMVANEITKKKTHIGEVINWKPSLADIKEVAEKVALEKAGLTPEEAKVLIDGLDADDVPMSGSLTQFFHGLGRPIVGLGNLVRRMGMTIGGTSQDAISYINQESLQDFSETFERAERQQLMKAPTMVGERLQNVQSAKGGSFNFSPSAIIATMADTMGQMVQAGGGGNLAAKALMQAGRSEKAAQTIGLFSNMMATTFDENYQAASLATNDPTKRLLYATLKSGATAGTELIFPETKWLNDVLKRMTAGELLEQVTKQGMSQLFTKQGMKTLIKSVGGNTLKEVGEEELDLASEFLLSQAIIPKNIEGRNFWSEAVETGIHTGIGTILPMSVSGMRNRSQPYKEMLYEVGVNPKTFAHQVEQMQERGEITADEANRKIQIINTLAQTTELANTANIDNKPDWVFNKLRNALMQEETKKLKNEPERLAQVQRELAADIELAKKNEAKIKAAAEASATATPAEEVVADDPEITDTDVLSSIEAFGEFIVPDRDQDETELGKAVMDSYGVTIPELAADQSYTVILPTHLGALATFVGAQVKPVGENNVQVTLNGDQLTQLRNQELKQQDDASTISKAENKTSTEQGGSTEYSPAAQREQEPTEGGATISQTDSGNSNAGIPQQSLQEKLAAAQATLPEQTTTMQDRLAEARASAARQEKREKEREARNAIPKPRFRVTLNEDGTISPVNETPNEQDPQNIGGQVPQNESAGIIEPGSEVNQGGIPQQPGTSGISGVYSFSEEVETPIEGLNVTSQKFRRGKPFIESVRDFIKKPSLSPVLAYLSPDGKMYVLDGRARILAAKARGEATVPVRFLKGTAEQASQVAELSRNQTSRKLAQVKADRVLSRPPESVEEAVLQGMLSSLRTGKPMFSLSDFKRFISAMASTNPYRLSYGKQSKDLTQLIRTRIVGDGGVDMDMFAEHYRNTVNPTADEQDIINQAVEAVMTYQTKESIINRLETLQGLEGVPLRENIMPLRMTEEEALFVSQEGLNNVIEEILMNADAVELTDEENQYLESVLRNNSNPDGSQLDIDGIYNDVFNAEFAEAKSISQKLIDYATQTEKTTPKLIGDSGGEALLADETTEESEGWTPVSEWDGEDTPFSRATAAGITTLTIPQAKKISRALSKAFKGLKVVIDRAEFARAIKIATARISGANFSKIPLEAQYYIDQLQSAQDILSAAQRAFTNKRKELDATLAADQENLFGERASLQENKLFDQRANIAAREAAIKPFKDRLDKARNTVNSLQKKVNDILKQGGSQQGAMFSKDGENLGLVLDGVVYLNPDAVRADTPLHEIGGHILTKWAKSNHPALYEKITSASALAPQEIIDFVKQVYPDIDENSDAFGEEVFATALGWDENNIGRAEAIANQTQWQSFKQAVKDIWNDIINFFIDNGVIDFLTDRKLLKVKIGFNAEEFNSMSLSDFTNLVGEVMFSGRRLSAPKELRNIKARADYAHLSEEDFLYDPYNNIIGVRPEVEAAIMAEKLFIRDKAIADGTFMQAPDGTDTHLSEDQWLTTRTVRFMEWDKGNLDEVFDEISKSPLPKDHPMRFIVDMASDRMQRFSLVDVLQSQSRTLSEFAGLVGIIGEDAAQKFKDYQKKEGKVLRRENGDPEVVNVDGNLVFIKGNEMKSAVSNTTFSDEVNDPRFQRIGNKAKLTPHQRQTKAIAVSMEEETADPAKIFLATGWFRGIDGLWRYELSNINVKYKFPGGMSEVKLGEILDFPELFEAYPEFREMRVVFTILIDISGLYSPSTNHIEINAAHGAFYQAMTLRHEIQHAIQHLEGFEFGSNLIVAEKYYDRKVVYTMSLVKEFRGLYERTSKYVANASPDSPSLPVYLNELNYFEEKTRQAEKLLNDLIKDKKYWVHSFYYHYAGELEAKSVEHRSMIDDYSRLNTLPEDLSKREVAIMYGDQQRLKPLFSASYFNNEGQYKGDRGVRAKTDLGIRFSRAPKSDDKNAKFERGLGMWQKTLELVKQVRERGEDKRVFLTSKEFLSIFGAKTYQQLPDDIIAITETIWKMNDAQQDNMLKAVTKTLNSNNNDKIEQFKKEMGKVRRPIIEDQKLREKKIEDVVVDRPEMNARVSSILQDIAAGKSDDEIVDERRAEIGTLPAEAEVRLRRKIASERREYQEFSDNVNAELDKLNRTADGRYIKQFHNRMKDSKFASTPAFKKLTAETFAYERTSQKDAMTKAREIVDAGIDVAIDQLHFESAGNSWFTPVLSAAILERLKVRKDKDKMAEVLEIMYSYSNQAGLNLNMVGAFYQMLGMADETGKVNFFIRVKNRQMRDFYEKMRRVGLNSEPFKEVRDIQADVLSKARGDSTFAARIKKLITNLRDC